MVEDATFKIRANVTKCSYHFLKENQHLNIQRKKCLGYACEVLRLAFRLTLYLIAFKHPTPQVISLG